MKENVRGEIKKREKKKTIKTNRARDVRYTEERESTTMLTENQEE